MGVDSQSQVPVTLSLGDPVPIEKEAGQESLDRCWGVLRWEDLLPPQGLEPRTVQMSNIMYIYFEVFEIRQQTQWKYEVNT